MTIKAIVFDFYGVIFTPAGIDETLLDFIRTLRRHYKVGILSNSANTLRTFLQEHTAQDMFDAIVVSAETPYIKPQREIFELAAKKLAVQLDEVFFVDDSPANITAAQSYGMQGHVYTTMGELREALKKEGL